MSNIKKALEQALSAFDELRLSPEKLIDTKEGLRQAILECDKQAPAAQCLWKYDQSSFFYNTACGHAFQFVDGDAKANGVTHCMYCGSHIEDMDEVDAYEC